MAPSTQYAPSGFKVWAPPPLQRAAESHRFRRSSMQAAQSATTRLPAGTWAGLNAGTRPPYPYPVDQTAVPPRPGSSRPPSAAGYRPPTAGADRDGMSHQYVSTSYHFPGSNARPPQGRSSTAPTPLQHIPSPQASSSKPTQESGGTRSVLSKMFSRVKSNSHSAPAASPPVVAQDDKSKRTQRNHRALSVQATSNPYSTSKPSPSNPPPSAPPTTTTWAAYEQAARAAAAPAVQRQESREDRSNAKLQKSKDKDRGREERHRERDERARAEEKARADYAAKKLEAEQAAASAKVMKSERPPSRRRERTDSKQEYDSDNVQKPVSQRYRSSDEAHVNDKNRYPASATTPANAQAPLQNGISLSSASALHPALRYPGVPVLPSTSSHSTSVSSKTLAGGPPPPKAPGYIPATPSQAAPPAANNEERAKLIREAEREAYARERDREKDRERTRDREREKQQREGDREARHREREREKEREREHKLEKHRSHRDRTQSQSLPVNTPVVSASDTERERERSGRRESRTHQRSTSHANPVSANISGQVPAPQDLRRPDSRRESLQPPSTTGLMKQQDTVVYPRNQSTVDPAQSQPVVQQNPVRHPERSRTDPVMSTAYYGANNHGTSHTTVSISPTSNSAWPNPNPRPHVVSIHAAQGPPDVVPHHAQSLPPAPHTAQSYSAAMLSRTSAGETQPPPSQYLRTDTNAMNPLDKVTSPSGFSSLLSPATFGVLPMSMAPSTSSSMNHHNDRRNSMAPSLLPGQTGQQGQNPYNGSPKSNAVGSQQPVPTYNTYMNNMNSGPGHVERAASQGPSSSPHSYGPALAVGRSPSTASQVINTASNSPGQRTTLQVPPGQIPGSSGVMSRTPSSTSQNESSTPRQVPSTPIAQPGASTLAPASSAAMYSTTQNISASSRASHAYPFSNIASVQSTAYPSHGIPAQQAVSRSEYHSSLQPSMDHSLSQQNVISHTSTHNVPSQPPQPMSSPYYAPQKTMSSTSAVANDSMSAANPVVLSQTHDPMYNNNASPHWTDPSVYQSGSMTKNGVPQSFGQVMASRPVTGESRFSEAPAGLHPGYNSSNQPPMSLSPPNSLLTLTNSPGPAAKSNSSAFYATSTRQPPGLGPALPVDPPGVGVSAPLTAMRTYSQSTPPEAHNSIAQPVPRVPSRAEDVAASTRVPVNGYQTTTPHLPEFDSPPPLTPSSSRDSHEDILMTPSSLDPAKGSVQPQRLSISIQRQEEPPKKKGLFGLFRSKSKEAREREQVEGEAPRQITPGPSQRSGGGNKLRSTRQPPGSAVAGLNGKAELSHAPEPSRYERPIPPPISIPPPSAFTFAGELSPSKFHAVRVRSKRYRTVSSASVEALDGTANNTVVGSPTSSMRSHTPGLLTPPIRDAIEAAQEWRDLERNFIDRGATRRRRPGVTFDVVDEDAPRNARLARASRLYGSGDLSE